jgi:hypothetical protein
MPAERSPTASLNLSSSNWWEFYYRYGRPVMRDKALPCALVHQSNPLLASFYSNLCVVLL